MPILCPSETDTDSVFLQDGVPFIIYKFTYTTTPSPVPAVFIKHSVGSPRESRVRVPDMGSSPVAAELPHPSPGPMPPAAHGRSAAPCS